jgi:hypothetical protein
MLYLQLGAAQWGENVLDLLSAQINRIQPKIGRPRW